MSHEISLWLDRDNGLHLDRAVEGEGVGSDSGASVVAAGAQDLDRKRKGVGWG